MRRFFLGLSAAARAAATDRVRPTICSPGPPRRAGRLARVCLNRAIVFLLWIQTAGEWLVMVFVCCCC